MALSAAAEPAHLAPVVHRSSRHASEHRIGEWNPHALASSGRGGGGRVGVAARCSRHGARGFEPDSAWYVAYGQRSRLRLLRGRLADHEPTLEEALGR